MKQYLLKISGLAMLALLLHGTGFAQQNQEMDDDDNDKGKLGNYDEIIIKRKGDKDGKVTVEIKNGDVLINGKPISEFDDDNISVRKKKIIVRDGDSYALTLPPHSPFRGGAWNYNGDNHLSDSKRAFLGVAAEEAKDGGAEIREVTKGSAAEKLGLKKGDIITKIDDVKIDGPEMLTETIRKHKPEDKVVVTYKRDGKEQKATAILGKFKGANINAYNFKMPNINRDFNFDFAPDIHINSDRPRIGIKAQDTEDGKGVKVLDVDEDSPAEKAGIEEGDIITQFDGKEVTGATELADLARDSRTKSSFKIKLDREGKSREVEVKIPKKLKTTDL
jgi:serine protease Do